MSRERLTSRTAEDLTAKAGKPVQAEGSKVNNDVYDMNNTGHAKNDPKMDQYTKGGPEEWAEGVSKENPAKDDKRNDMHVPELIDKHAAREAISSVKRLEDKAVRCIVAAQRILPGAPDDMIQDQAADFMAMPEASLNATLTRQEKLAKMIAAAAEEKGEDDKDEKKEDDKKEDDKKEDDKKEDDKKEDDKKDDFAAKMKALRDKKAALEAEIAACAKEEESEAGKCVKEEEGTEAAKKEETSETDKKEETPDTDKKEEPSETDKKEEDSDPSTKEAGSLLDVIFSEVTASDSKKGAATLSGMVKKQASEQVTDLSNMWRTDPDVSTYFS